MIRKLDPQLHWGQTTQGGSAWPWQRGLASLCRAGVVLVSVPLRRGGPEPQPPHRADHPARPRLYLLRDPHTLQPRPREAFEAGLTAQTSLSPVAPGAACTILGNKGKQYRGCQTGR